MTARVLNIAQRHLQTPGQLASLADFTYTDGEAVDSRIIVEDPDLTLYCLDDESKRAVFTQLPPGVDLTQVPFVYLTQGEQAEHLVAVPYDDFLALAAELPEVENLICVCTTSRSGSTLLSHIFNEVDGVISLSEPDAASQFNRLREPNGSRDAELSRLLDATVRFLYRPNAYKQVTTRALKLRGEAIRVMDLYHRTFPRAKSLLSYREAVSTVASFYRAFRDLGMAERQPQDMWVGYLRQTLGRSESEIKGYLGGSEDVAMVRAIALCWLFLMEDCLAQHERGVRALAVRYDDLNGHREDAVREIFDYCGLPLLGVEKALRAFDKDAQAGTSLARTNPMRGNTLKLSEEQCADVYDVLERHPVINTPDFVLPGTLTI